MTQNKLSFEFENLLVNYFFKMGFNSIERSKKLADPIKKPIHGTSENKFHVTFDIDYPYWTGTVLQISKQSATFFTSLLKKIN